MPHPRTELSVYRIDGCSIEEVTAIGMEIAAERERKHREKQLADGKPYPADKRSFVYLGRGELQATDARSVGLEVVPKEPPARHANILGWPNLTGDRKADEAAQMAYALALQNKIRYLPAE